MPKLKAAEFVSFNPEEPAPVWDALRKLLKERITTDTGLLIRRIVRKMSEEGKHIDSERLRLLEQYAEKEEDGTLKTHEGAYVLADEAGFKAEYRTLMETEFDFPEGLTKASLVRKERDKDGKVFETDELPGEVIIGLGDLLQDDAPGAAA
jgi:hypothetical protein